MATLSRFSLLSAAFKKGTCASCNPTQVRGAGKRVVVALPRILKPDEQRLWWFYLRLNADALLVRGAGALQQFTDLGGTGACRAGFQVQLCTACTFLLCCRRPAAVY